MRRLAQPIGLALAALAPGCYWIADAGYVTRVPFDGVGGGSITLRAGAGDLRDPPLTLGATGLESDVRIQIGDGFDRLGLGFGLLYTTSPEWDEDWTPILRPTVHVPQVEWLGHGATFTFSPGLEAGALFLRGRGSNGRDVVSVTFAADYSVRGPDDPNAFFFGLNLGWGYSASLTIP